MAAGIFTDTSISYANIEGTSGGDTIRAAGAGATIQTYRGDDVIFLSGSSNIAYGGSGDDTVSVLAGATVFGEDGSDYIYVAAQNTSADGGAGDDYFYLDSASAVTITTGDGLDTVRINPAQGRKISAVITDWNNRDLLVNEAPDADTDYLTYSTISGGVVLADTDPNTFSITLQGVSSLSQIAGFQYRCNSTTKTLGEIFGLAVNTNSDYINLTSGDDNFTVDSNNVTINALGGNDTINIRYDGYDVSVNGGDGDDSIFGAHQAHNSNITIIGGAGNDTINLDEGNNAFFDPNGAYFDGGEGNDVIILNKITVYSDWRLSTVVGGKGDDVIRITYKSNKFRQLLYQYNAGDGNDTIFGYDVANTLQVSGGTYSTIVSGDDILVKVGEGSILLKDAASISPVIEGEYEASQPASLTVSGGVLSIGSTFDGDSIRASDYDVTKVDATSLSRGIKIWGGNAADCILGGSGNDTIHGSNGADILYGGEGADKLLGGNGNDTLYGGAGNDTLTGSNGADVFVYESGSDLITDYRADYDKIKIASGSITGSSLSGSNVILTTSGGSLTVKNGRGKNLTVIDASGRETTRKYSNSGSSAMFFSDDNFISGETNLDAIITENLAPDENVAQPQRDMLLSTSTNTSEKIMSAAAHWNAKS